MPTRRSLIAVPAFLVTTALLTPAGSSAAPSDASLALPGAEPGVFAGVADRAAKQPAVRSRAGTHSVAVGRGGAVASETIGASKAGRAVLRRGGNAIDAAVATAAALGVDDPFVAGPGGGGFMVIYLARQHRIVTIDGRETCPAACTPKLFRNRAGEPLDFELARHSGISIGVPGMVAQWAKATRRYGLNSFAENLRPAIRLATRGFKVTKAFRTSTRESLADLRAFRSSRKLFLTPSGNPLPLGSTLRNPDLARTYRLLARHGASYLYEGPLGRDIARTVRQPPVVKQLPAGFRVIKGRMTGADVRMYRAKMRPPTHIRYRGLDIFSMGPPSSGGSTVGEALNILSGWNLGSESRVRALFHYIEASRLAFADRNAYVGDRDYVQVPLTGLLNKQFAATRRCLVKNKALQSPVAPGDPYPPYSSSCGRTTPGPDLSQREGTSTNHLVTADRWGNVVSYTNTIEQLAGSGMTVPGRGFLLNNELTDFSFAPVTPGTYDPNLPAPGKRPRSSMSPTIVLRDGRPWLALGSPGGTTIITTVLQTLVNRIDLGLSLPKAINTPRANQSNSTTTSVEPAFARSRYAKVLTRRYGERFTTVGAPEPYIGFVNGLEFLGPRLIQVATERWRSGGGTALVVRPGR